MNQNIFVDEEGDIHAPRTSLPLFLFDEAERPFSPSLKSKKMPRQRWIPKPMKGFVRIRMKGSLVYLGRCVQGFVC